MNRHVSVRVKIKRRRGGLPREKHRTKGGSWWKWVVDRMRRKRKPGPVYATVEDLMKAEKPKRKSRSKR